MKIANDWRADKLKAILTVVWLMTVFSAFFGSTITLVYLPAIGAMYPFRILLPVTAVLYLIWIIRERHNPWKDASNVQRICYVLCVVLVVYGAISIFRAIDFAFTFRRWFNLCFDLCFFYLALELCKDRAMFLHTVRCGLVALLVQIPMGIIEVFFGGIFDPKYDTDHHRFAFFRGVYQRPVVAAGNTNDYAMMLIFMLALLLLYWAWRRREERCDWIPVALIAPIYFLICAGDARLCEIAFWILTIGFVLYAMTLRNNKWWILIPTVLLMAFVMFGHCYQPVNEDYAAQGNLTSSNQDVVFLETVQSAPLAEAPSLKEEMFIIDEETGQIQANLSLSAGARLDLLMHAAKCVVQSKGLGVGLGNTEQLAQEGAAERIHFVWNIHCFIARMAGDFGIFFLIPLLLIVVLLLRECFARMRQGAKNKKAEEIMLWVLYLTTLFSYPIASTASSDAQDCIPMWLFLAAMVLFPVHIQETEQL